MYYVWQESDDKFLKWAIGIGESDDARNQTYTIK